MPTDERKPPEQIPWATHTRVGYQSDTSIALEHEWNDRRRNRHENTADIWKTDCEWSVSLASRGSIERYMDYDEGLSADLREFWEEDKEKYPGSPFKDRILRWLKGGEFRAFDPGPKEWRPRRNQPRIKIGKLTETYGYANTYNEDNTYWWGDMFEFAHFELDELAEEGAVILWNTGGGPLGSYSGPEVWRGDFEQFFESQREGEPYSYETFLHWNGYFENGFMWAFHKLGYFEAWDEHVLDPYDRRVVAVLEAIEHDPGILLPESVEQILEKGLEYYPEEIQKAVTWLMTNKRRELEKALGQKLIWGDLYPDG